MIINKEDYCCCFRGTKSFVVEASSDNVYWAPVVSGSFDQEPTDGTGGDKGIFVFDRPYFVRFIRFRVLEYYGVGPALITFLPVIPGLFTKLQINIVQSFPQKMSVCNSSLFVLSQFGAQLCTAVHCGVALYVVRYICPDNSFNFFGGKKTVICITFSPRK